MSVVYPAGDLLLPRFTFPEAYSGLLCAKSLPDIPPWWWITDKPDVCRFWFEILKKQFPLRNLVPIAKVDDSDDLVCFDGNDETGEPRVLYIHAYTDPGRELRGEILSFSKFIIDARVYSEGYVKALKEASDD